MNKLKKLDDLEIPGIDFSQYCIKKGWHSDGRRTIKFLFPYEIASEIDLEKLKNSGYEINFYVDPYYELRPCVTVNFTIINPSYYLEITELIPGCRVWVDECAEKTEDAEFTEVKLIE